MGKELNNALSKGNVVVVAGACISKDMPANLPSWWEYNRNYKVYLSKKSIYYEKSFRRIICCLWDFRGKIFCLVQIISRSEQINVIHTTLQDFYKMQGWDVPECTYDVDHATSFRQIASEKIRTLLESPHIGKWACAGMCLSGGALQEVRREAF